ncbi:aryl-sulfate sulfotransferase [candidate division KSB1 bacterium]|nr:aryl-sulfate sulfotransferase [candidate division KSB1 bacterium]
MKKRYKALNRRNKLNFVTGLILLIMLCNKTPVNAIPESILYLHPLPDSKYVSKQTTLLLRFRQPFTEYDYLHTLFEVNGQQSGLHTGTTLFSDDAFTIIFKPYENFSPGETVNVVLSYGTEIFCYKFTISEMRNLQYERVPQINKLQKPFETDRMNTMGEVTTINGVSVPGDFPRINILKSNGNTAPGRLFACFLNSYSVILENDGTPYYYEKSGQFHIDFKIQPNGYLSKTVPNPVKSDVCYVTMDNNFNNADTFAVKHGYITDHHDFVLLPDGHHLLICNDYQEIDMSSMVEGGKRANVLGHHIQELDSNKNVIFEWRSWDHLDITDAVHEDLTGNSIDFAHINSVAIDYDGHIIISCRNISQVIKINRQTGEIFWRLGGEKNSLQFINDTDQNFYQHMAQPVPGKPDHYTLFDNGNHRYPQYSRAAEFSIDPVNKTAERVWEYRHEPNYWAGWLGSVQRLPNGNTLINWSGGEFPFAQEVTAGGETVYEAILDQQDYTYRTFRFEWEGKADRPHLFLENLGDRLVLVFNQFGDPNVEYYKIYSGFLETALSLLDTTSLTRYDFQNPENDTRYYFTVTSVDGSGCESKPSDTNTAFVRFHMPNENIVRNGQFSQNSLYWSLKSTAAASAQGLIRSEEYLIDIQNEGLELGDIQLVQTGIPLYKDRYYTFEFDAYSTKSRKIEAIVIKNNEPWTNYGKIGASFITDRQQHFKYEFMMENYSDTEANISFKVGGDTADVFIDNVSLKFTLSNDVKPKVFSHTSQILLQQNYPNPFNKSTVMLYSLASTSRVKLVLFNVLGRTVWESQPMTVPAGQHSIRLDPFWLPSGVYFCRLTGINSNHQEWFSETKKILYIR